MTADDRVGTTYNHRGRHDRMTIGSTVTGDYTYEGRTRLAIPISSLEISIDNRPD